jgi:hypothetical protein
MALLGVIGDAMQALEDLAFLATAWDSPLTGIAHYVRATTYTPQTAQTFWQEVKVERHWDDARIEVFAGLSMHDPDTSQVQRSTEIPGSETSWSAEDRALFDEIAAITVAKLRRLLSGLSDDWMQFLPYFQSFKHGGLAVSRQDTFFVDDGIADEDVDESTPRHHPSICVWTRGGRKQELAGDFAATAEQVSRTAASAGQLALNMIEVFVEMRLWVFDAVELTEDGRIARWKGVQIPFTDWLIEKDLPIETWQRIGRGPRMLIGGGDAEV